MEPRQYITALLRSWFIILIACIAGGGLAFGLASARTPSYEAQAVTQLGVPAVANGSELWQTTNANVVLASSYTQLVSSPLVTSPAAKEVGDITPEQIATAVSAKAPLETLNIMVSARDNDPERAARIATAVAKAMQGAVAEIAPRNSEGQPAVVLHLTQEAAVPKSPAGLSNALLTAIGAVAGMALGVLVALVRKPSGPRHAAKSEDEPQEDAKTENEPQEDAATHDEAQEAAKTKDEPRHAAETEDEAPEETETEEAETADETPEDAGTHDEAPEGNQSEELEKSEEGASA